MTTWSKDELHKIAQADDLHISPMAFIHYATIPGSGLFRVSGRRALQTLF
jgi:hypothetical protein